MAKFDVNTMRKKQRLLTPSQSAEVQRQAEEPIKGTPPKPKKDKPPPKPKPDKIVYVCKHEEPIKQVESHPCPKCTVEAKKQRGIRKREKQVAKENKEKEWMIVGTLNDPVTPLILVRCKLTGAEGRVEQFTHPEWEQAVKSYHAGLQLAWLDAARVLVREDYGGWKTEANKNIARLPDGCRYDVKYDGKVKEWTGTLEIPHPSGGETAFKGTAGGVFRLLSDLDGMYRQWKSQQGASDEKAIPTSS